MRRLDGLAQRNSRQFLRALSRTSFLRRFPLLKSITTRTAPTAPSNQSLWLGMSLAIASMLNLLIFGKMLFPCAVPRTFIFPPGIARGASFVCPVVHPFFPTLRYHRMVEKALPRKSGLRNAPNAVN